MRKYEERIKEIGRENRITVLPCAQYNVARSLVAITVML